MEAKLVFKEALISFDALQISAEKQFLSKKKIFLLECLTLKNTLYLAYLWLSKTLVSSAIIHVSCSSATAIAYYDYFRQLIADLIDENQSIIGGEEVVVEIDETKVGKRKYNKSHRVDGVWVVGGVERTKKRCVFAVNVEKRDNKTLLDVIKKHVATRLNRTHRLLEVIQ